MNKKLSLHTWMMEKKAVDGCEARRGALRLPYSAASTAIERFLHSKQEYDDDLKGVESNDNTSPSVAPLQLEKPPLSYPLHLVISAPGPPVASPQLAPPVPPNHNHSPGATYIPWRPLNRRTGAPKPQLRTPAFPAPSQSTPSNAFHMPALALKCRHLACFFLKPRHYYSSFRAGLGKISIFSPHATEICVINRARRNLQICSAHLPPYLRSMNDHTSGSVIMDLGWPLVCSSSA